MILMVTTQGVLNVIVPSLILLSNLKMLKYQYVKSAYQYLFINALMYLKKLATHVKSVDTLNHAKMMIGKCTEVPVMLKVLGGIV